MLIVRTFLFYKVCLALIVVDVQRVFLKTVSYFAAMQ